MAQDSVAGWGDRSRVFRLAEVVPRHSPNGGESWQIGSGPLVTGEVVSLHESTQPAGVAPNPAHAIEHTECICVRSGSLSFTHDGRTERAEAGDVLFVAKGTMHGVRNVGDGPATYFVLAIGGDTR